jgi:hypothetical protein
VNATASHASPADPRRARGLLIAVAVLVRLGPWLGYGPATAPDSETYLLLSRLIRDGGLAGYEGQRTPVYPLFLLLCGLEPRAIMIAQGVLGILTSVLLFELSWWHTRRARIALAIGLSHSLALDLLLYESIVLTETLTTFLLVGSCVLVRVLLDRDRVDPGLAALLGAILSLLALTRPMFLFVAPLFALVVLLPWRGSPPNLRGRVWRVAAMVVPVIVLVGSWCLFNGRVNGTFGLTTMAGFHLTQHSGAIMEDAPDSTAMVRDIYLAHRVEQRARKGTHANTIWDALPDLQRATGATYAQLSKRMGRISIELLMRHPGSYVRTAFYAWTRFWTRPIHWEVERFGRWSRALRALWSLEFALGLGANAVFLGLCLRMAFDGLRRRPTDPWLAVLAAVILGASVAQALMETAGNGRYAIPLLPLVQYVVLTWTGLAIARRSVEAGERPGGTT